jgi:hypothetical protein
VRRRCGPGKGATLEDVMSRKTLVPRPRKVPGGPKQGGNQPTDISRINRRDLLAPPPPVDIIEIINQRKVRRIM